MFTFDILKNNVGLLLISDYVTLRYTHDIIHQINDRSPLIRDKEGVFLELAYEVRKAYSGERKIIKPHKHYEEVGVRYGLPIPWPTLLLHQRMMRVSLAYIDHSYKEQSILYGLEHVIDEAIREVFKDKYPDIKQRWLQIDPSHPDIEGMYKSRMCVFGSWNRTKRINMFEALLLSFNPLYNSYYKLHSEMGNKNLIKPDEFNGLENANWPVLDLS